MQKTISLLITLLFISTFAVSAQTVDRARLDQEIETLWEQIKEKQELLIAPSPEDRAAYAEFLNQPNTGLIRLLPRERYDYAQKLPIRGGGSYYSFVLRTHEYGRGSDIALEQGKLSSGFAGADYGFLLSLGNLPLEQVNLEMPAVKALAAYVPPPTEKETRSVARERYTGVKIGEFTFQSPVPAESKRTFLLRSISIDSSDVIVVFRVLRRDFDGSLILLWKTLMTFPTPRMIRAEQ